MAVIGIGVDVVEVARMRAALERTPSLARRLFSDAEAGDGSAQRLASRFAAKEAVAKALGTGIDGFAFRDIEIISTGSDRPTVALHGGAAQAANDRGVRTVHLSLSHTDTVVVANAVAER